MRLRSAVLMVITALAQSCSDPNQTGNAPDRTMSEIRPEAIRSHVGFLSDDLLEGRGTGTRGYLLAAHYVAAQFEAMGIRPAGTDGSYFQRVPLRRTEVVPEQTTLAIVRNGREETLTLGKDFLTTGDPLRPNTSVRAPAVFVGFGATAPELSYDDYRDVDTHGKIVVLLSGAPPAFPSTQRAHYSSVLEKSENAARHGAVGMVFVISPEDEKKFPWDQRVRLSGRGGMSWLDGSGRPNGESPEIRGRVTVNPATAAHLFGGVSNTLAEAFAAAGQSQPRSFALPVSIDMQIASRHQALESPNVVGLLTGSHPQLRDEYVVFTAHLDHEGIGEPVDGDNIYNGALDNASGVASMLEIARAFSRLSTPPSRSILFIAVTAEEEGLLGSDYFASNPTVAAAGLVANINVDVTALLYPVLDLVALGSENSTLGEPAQRAAARLGLEISPDFAPDEVFFVRSDQYSFVRKGIPSVYVYQGLKSSSAQIDGSDTFTRWMSTVYHTPKDDFNQPMDFQSAAKEAQFDFLLGYYVATGSNRPQWNPGDFFGSKYGKP